MRVIYRLNTLQEPYRRAYEAELAVVGATNGQDAPVEHATILNGVCQTQVRQTASDGARI
jgi:hypothetical protein